MGFFFKKKKEWREDDEPFLSELKGSKEVEQPKAGPQKVPQPMQRKPIFMAQKPELSARKPESQRKPVTYSDHQLTVKQRLEKMQAQGKSQVLQRLENMREEPKPVPRALDFMERREEPPKRELLDADSQVIAKLDRAIKKLDMLRGKMHKADSYLSLFYELKIAEKEFMEAYQEIKDKDVDLTPMLEQRAEQLKASLRSVKSA